MNQTKQAGNDALPQAQRDPHQCGHGRLVDEYRTTDGNETGKLICRECGTVFEPRSQAKRMEQAN